MNLFFRIKSIFDHIRDHFIAEEILENSNIDVVYRFRMLSGMALICILVVLVFICIYPFLSHFKYPANVLSSLAGTVLIAFHAYILASLKKQQTPDKLSHKLVASLIIAITCGIVLTGGALSTFISIFYPLPAIMAFMLLGKKNGMYYSWAVYLSFMAIYSLENNGYSFPQTFPEEYLNSIQVMLWIVFATATLSLINAYEDLTLKLINERKEEQKKLEYMATHDALTGLSNRQKFDEQLNEAIHRSQRLNTSVALFILDLDKFKFINDSFGHDAGDAILRHVSSQIENTIRTDDLAARLGGDEFAIIIQGDCNQERLSTLAQRLIENICNPFEYKQKMLTPGVSIGISVFPNKVSSEEMLRISADRAMYAAKNSNKHWVFSVKEVDEESQV